MLKSSVPKTDATKHFDVVHCGTTPESGRAT